MNWVVVGKKVLAVNEGDIAWPEGQEVVIEE